MLEITWDKIMIISDLTHDIFFMYMQYILIQEFKNPVVPPVALKLT
jgi:hypothetical protein